MADKGKGRMPYQAYLPRERPGHLFGMYLQRYQEDADFRTALTRFRDGYKSVFAGSPSHILSWRHRHRYHPYRAEWPADYLTYATGLSEFGTKWALDRISDERGYEALHGCMWLCHRDPDLFPSISLGSPPVASFIPQVGEVVHRHEYEATNSDGETVTVVDETRFPVVRVTVEDSWYANHEPFSYARQRLIDECTKQIDAELARIAALYEEADYVFPDTEPMTRTYIDWLYRIVVKGETRAAIEGISGRASETIRKRTREIAKEIGMTTPREPEWTGRSRTV